MTKPKSDNPLETNQANNKTPGSLSSLGTNIAVGMLFFGFIGYKLYQKMNHYIWLIIGVLLALIYCGYEVWKVSRQ